jgi:hypothetical protein
VKDDEDMLLQLCADAAAAGAEKQEAFSRTTGATVRKKKLKRTLRVRACDLLARQTETVTTKLKAELVVRESMVKCSSFLKHDVVLKKTTLKATGKQVAASAVTPTATASAVAPTATASAVTPTATASAVAPTATATLEIAVVSEANDLVDSLMSAEEDQTHGAQFFDRILH